MNKGKKREERERRGQERRREERRKNSSQGKEKVGAGKEQRQTVRVLL